jgi:hypothetical protein
MRASVVELSESRRGTRRSVAPPTCSIRQHTSAYVSVWALADLQLQRGQPPGNRRVCGLQLLVQGALSYQCMGP